MKSGNSPVTCCCQRSDPTPIHTTSIILCLRFEGGGITSSSSSEGERKVSGDAARGPGNRLQKKDVFSDDLGRIGHVLCPLIQAHPPRLLLLHVSMPIHKLRRTCSNSTIDSASFCLRDDRTTPTVWLSYSIREPYLGCPVSPSLCPLASHIIT